MEPYLDKSPCCSPAVVRPRRAIACQRSIVVSRRIQLRWGELLADHGIFRQRSRGRSDSHLGRGGRQGHVPLRIFHHLGRIDRRGGGEPDCHQRDHWDDDLHLRERGRRDFGEPASDRAVHSLPFRRHAKHHNPGVHAFPRGWQHKHDGQRLGIPALRACAMPSRSDSSQTQSPRTRSAASRMFPPS
jgi:hypothetical protein